jgi:hypothetical protein
MTVVKSNKQQIKNTDIDQSLRLRPHGKTSLGFGFNYKWLGLSFTKGIPMPKSEEKIYGKTTQLDFQLNVYSKKIVVDAFVQHYKGLYVENPAELTTWNKIEYPQNDSMQTVSVGIAGFYVYNNKKLSYKASYIRNAAQKKSAGSFLLGGYANHDYAGVSSRLTSLLSPKDFSQEQQDKFAISLYEDLNYGISFGYTYTLVVWKKWFVNLTLLPGIGQEHLIVLSNGIKETKKGVASRFSGRLAMGFEGKHFSIGFTSIGTTGNLEFNQYEIKPSTENARFFFAKRFNVKKKK